MKLLLERVVDINRNRKGNSNMKYGCFGFSNQLTDIAAAGFDSAELDFCEFDYSKISQTLNRDRNEGRKILQSWFS